MADTRPIIFGPGDKLRWLESIAFDEFSTPFDVRVAVALSNRVDKYSGIAIVSQAWIAEKLGASERGVRQSLDRLVCRLAFEVKHSRGRGLANEYRLLKTGTPIPLLDTEKRNGATRKEERDDAKRGMGVPPLPKYLPNILPKEGAHHVECGPDDELWEIVKARLATDLGAAVVQSWFCQVTTLAAEPGEVVLGAPTRFIAARIERDYRYALERAWRAVALVETVHIRVAGSGLATLMAAE